MNVNRLNYNVLIRIIGIITFSVIGGAAGISHFYYFMAISIGAVLILTVNTLTFINGTNRKLTYFFDAIRNEDTSLILPETVKDKSLAELHTSLNRINRYIADIKLQNAQNERFLNELMQSSATGLFSVDEKNFVKQINQTALTLIGMPHLLHFNLLQQKNAELYAILSQIKPGETKQIKVNDPKGTRLLSIKVANFNFADKQFRIFSLNDIRSEMEENELDSWQKLIRVLTHEMMNSLAPITSLSNTLCRFFVRNETVVNAADLSQRDIDQTVQGLAVIEDRCKGLVHFVDNYRKLTRIPKPVIADIQINEWLNSLYLLIEQQLKNKNIEFSIIRNERNTTFPTDEKLLTQVLLNIIGNACDALTHSVSKKITLITRQTPSNYFTISISDTGCGMDAATLENIFVPFFTTKENGSGIGLSLSRQIINLLRGCISVHSVVNEGTTTTLTF